MACNTIIDYSLIPGNRILPFLIQLDLNKSVLNPPVGTNQRFCYTVTGIGTNSPQYVNLSHLVLGICNQILQSQIVNITVTIDGVEQTVVFGAGGNVQLRTPAQPDPPTGCAGLKFNFGLNKIGGIMEFCFELTSVYPVGSNNICLRGGTTTAQGLTICSPVCGKPCTVSGYQKAAVCVPVTITPFVNVLPTETFCCGSPTVMPGTGICSGTPNGNCHFTLSQKICVSVPVNFGAITLVGAPVVQCGVTTSEDVCTNCT